MAEFKAAALQAPLKQAKKANENNLAVTGLTSVEANSHGQSRDSLRGRLFAWAGSHRLLSN
jgi:hypothetical protein